MIVSLSFLADYLLTVIFALDRWAYIFSFNGIVDLISILPLGSFLAFHFGLLGPPDDINETAIMWLEIGNLCRCVRRSEREWGDGEVRNQIDRSRPDLIQSPIQTHSFTYPNECAASCAA